MCLPPVSILLNLQVPPHSPWPPSTSGLVPVSQFLVFSPSCSLGEVRENWKHILRNLLSKLETNLRNHSLKALFSANRRECLLLLSYFYWRRQWHPTPELFCLENPMDGGAWWAAVHGVSKSQTRLSDFTFIFTFMHWRRKWQPTPVFFPGESQGWGSLVGCHLWGRTETEAT